MGSAGTTTISVQLALWLDTNLLGVSSAFSLRSYPVAFPKTLEPNDSNKLDPDGGGARIRKSHGLPADSSLDNYTLWGSIIATYIKGELSSESDKLVALSGIAAQMQKILGDQYLAGLWRNHFADQLLWTAEYASTRSKKSTRPHEYRAPSWSWAAIDSEIGRLGHIRYSDGRGIMVDVIAVCVNLASGDPFGQITGAFLQVKGKLAKAAMYVSEPPSGIWSFGVYAKTLKTTVLITFTSALLKISRARTTHMRKRSISSQ